MDMDLSKLEGITLEAGWHEPEELDAGRMCMMEAAAYIVGEQPTPYPACVSPVLANFARYWEDVLDDHCPDLLPELVAYVPRVIGTADGDLAAERRRAWLAADWAVRVAAPTYLRHAGLPEQAERLAALPPVTDTTWEETCAAIRAAQAEARASDRRFNAIGALATAEASVGGAHAGNALYAAQIAALIVNGGWPITVVARPEVAAVLRELHPTMRALFEAMITAA